MGSLTNLDSYRAARATHKQLPESALALYDFELPVAQADTDIEDVVAEKAKGKTIKLRDAGEAIIRSFWFTMTDGTRYRASIGENTDEAIALNVPVIRTNPLFMRHQGALRERSINNIEAGWPTIHISTKQTTGSLDFNRMVHDQYMIAGWMYGFSHDNQGVQPLHSSLVRLEGQSRSAILALGMAAHADNYGYEVLDMRIEAPAVSELVTRDDYRKHLGMLVARELIEIGKLLGDSKERPQLLRNRNMICRTPGEFASNFGDAITLAQGVGGKASAALAREMKGHIEYYEDDHMLWRPYYEHFKRHIGKKALFPNITQEILPGSHGTFATAAATGRHAEYVEKLAADYRNGDYFAS